MSKQDSNAYILGTDKEELHRLGIQHQVWASEARKGWEIAGFGHDQTILDLGSGPGFCTRELAYMVGSEGKVIAVDKSKAYIDFLNQTKDQHGLNIEAICTDFDKLKLQDNSLDGIYCRWALAWIPNPEEIIEKLFKALRPGGAFVVHEYFDWSTFQTEPEMPHLKKGISAILKSFKDQAGDIDVGRKLPVIFGDNELEVISLRPMSKMATPEDMTWQWPFSFLNIYLPKLVDMNMLSPQEVEDALTDLDELSDYPDSVLLCPSMIEVVAVKI